MTDTQDIPTDELEDLQRLLRLKNYEQPVEGYFEDFLDEFHRRQRQSVAQVSSGSLWNRFAEWFQDLGAAKWAIGAGVAYAVLALGFFGTLGTSSSSNGSSGLAKEAGDYLPEGSKLQHVELETQGTNEESLEILPSEF